MLILFLNKTLYFLRRNTGVVIGFISIIVSFFLSFFPFFTELVYRNTIYQLWRIIWDNSFARIGLPVGSIISILLIIRYVFKLKKRGLSILFRLLNTFGYIIFFFYILWGFNYSAIDVKDKLGLEISDPTIELLADNMEISISEIENYRKNLQTSIITEEMIPSDLEETILPLVKKVLLDFNYPTYGEVRCNEISESGWMRSLGISGIYFPFAMESYVDESQHPISKTFAMAHEMAHGYGITNEGEANFIAYLALTKSENELLQYIAEFELLSYKLVKIRNLDFDKYELYFNKLPYWVKEDIYAIRENAKQHKTKFPWLSNKMNDIYLKSQGVKEGTDSYDSILSLVFAYKKQN